jgi:HK97 family phage major capsid protein
MSKDEQTIEIDADVTKAIADEATKQVTESIKVPTAKEIAEEMVALTEKTVKKEVKEDKPAKVLKTGIATLPAEIRFAKAVIAHKNHDLQGILEYNAYSQKEWSEKANYQNVGTAADGGALVPDPEFVAEIERLTDDYGTASRMATIRSTDRDSVTLLSGTNEVSFTATNEATAQNAQKLTYSAATVSLNKYIATLVMTSELVEDSAINIWQDASNEVARARAKLIDQLVFTDSTTGLLSAGIGDTYKTVTVGSAYTDFDPDDAMNAIYKVVSSARRNGRFYMHPTVWNALRQKKNAVTTSGALNYLFGGPGETVAQTIDGYPVELVDVLPDTGDITANEAFAVFGDLSRVKVHVKRALELKTFDSGVVKDAGGSDINLITQDSWALRATTRMVPQTRFEGAFVIIGTGTVS